MYATEVAWNKASLLDRKVARINLGVYARKVASNNVSVYARKEARN